MGLTQVSPCPTLSEFPLKLPLPCAQPVSWLNTVEMWRPWGFTIDYDTMPQAILDKCTPIGRQLLGAKASHLGYYVPQEADVPLKAWYVERFGEAVRA